MGSINITKLFFEKLIKQLSESDIDKVAKGTHELSVKLVKKKAQPLSGEKLSESLKKELFLRLYKCASREDGYAAVSKALKNKKELEQFAKHLDILVLREDKADTIQKKIIEATVGAVLRSNAIQGKNIAEQ